MYHILQTRELTTESLNDSLRWLGQHLDPGLSGPELKHFSTMSPCRFLSTPNKMREWSLTCSQTLGETSNYRTVVCLTNKCKNSYGGKAVTGEEKIRESQREEITIELGLEG